MSEIRDYREMQETEMSRDIESLVVKKESSECSGLLSSIDHNISDAHAGYNVHREAFNEAAVISGDLFQPFNHSSERLTRQDLKMAREKDRDGKVSPKRNKMDQGENLRMITGCVEMYS